MATGQEMSKLEGHGGTVSSVAISPDGKKLFMATQNPLIQDGALNAGNSRRGTNIRIVQFDIESGAAEKQFLYVLGDGTTNAPDGGRSLGINDMVAVNDHEFLIVERDGNAGTAAVVKRVVKIDLTGATDISGIATLQQTGVPPGVTPVTKTTFIDLAPRCLEWVVTISYWQPEVELSGDEIDHGFEVTG